MLSEMYEKKWFEPLGFYEEYYDARHLLADEPDNKYRKDEVAHYRRLVVLSLIYRFKYTVPYVLRDLFNIPHGNISRLISSMERQKLIKKVATTFPKFRYVILLTQDGLNALSDAEERPLGSYQKDASKLNLRRNLIHDLSVQTSIIGLCRVNNYPFITETEIRRYARLNNINPSKILDAVVEMREGFLTGIEVELSYKSLKEIKKSVFLLNELLRRKQLKNIQWISHKQGIIDRVTALSKEPFEVLVRGNRRTNWTEIPHRFKRSEKLKEINGAI